jgi:hypothetical protein
MPFPHTRVLRRALLPLLAALCVAPLLASPPAQASTVNGVTLNRYEAAVLSGINAQRTARGLNALVVASGATDVARRWSARMASVSSISHNPALASSLSAAGSWDWHFIAENVGYAPGSNPSSLVSAYMNSPGHRANILDPRARYVGVGAADALVNGYVMAFNTLDFVDAYSSSYGRTREPADAMPYDGGLVSTDRTLAAFESSWDPRVRTASYGSGLATWGVAYTGPTGADDAARFSVKAQSLNSTGAVDLLMRLPLDLSRARYLRLELSAVTGDGSALPVEVLVGNRTSMVSLGTVGTSATARTVTLAIPSAGRRFNDQLRIRVSASRLASLSNLLVDRQASVRVYTVDALV